MGGRRCPPCGECGERSGGRLGTCRPCRDRKAKAAAVSPEDRERYAAFRKERWFRAMVGCGDPALARLACQMVLADPVYDRQKRLREGRDVAPRVNRKGPPGAACCGRCGLPGHNARTCENASPGLISNVPRDACQRCGRVGHPIEYCPWQLPPRRRTPDIRRSRPDRRYHDRRDDAERRVPGSTEDDAPDTVRSPPPTW